MRSIADHGIGSSAEVSPSEAAEAITEATRFIALVEPKLAAPPP